MRIYRKKIERITIIGFKGESGKAFSYCHHNGYRIIRSGPKKIAKYKYSPDKYKIVAERELYE